MPDNLYGEEVAVADTVDNIGNLSWQEIFTDPRLQELIEQGLRNNTDLQSAQWRVKEAEAAMPVSYTHLDVYKRQALHGSGCCRICKRIRLCKT